MNRIETCHFHLNSYFVESQTIRKVPTGVALGNASVLRVMGSKTYQPLNPTKKQVRLLRLAPGKILSPIRGSLIVVSLDKLRRRKWRRLRIWSALSYVWGTSPQNHSIKISRQHVPITPTLRNALQFLRYPDGERYLWIDQICINQEDIQERNAQVQLMHAIYSGASHVIAWFDPLFSDSPENLADLFSLINRAGPKIQNTPDVPYGPKEEPGRTVLANTRMEVTEMLRLHHTDLTFEQVVHRLYEYLREFFRTSWFQRLWTLQEGILGEFLFLQVGWTYIAWSDLMQVYDKLRLLSYGSPKLVPPIEILNGIVNLTDLRNRIHRIDRADLCLSDLVPHIHRKASDDRDCIYGLLGMLSNKFIRLIEPNYSLDVDTVFKKAALAMIQTDEHLAALGLCCAGNQSEKYRLPSWCQDWSKKSSSRCRMDNILSLDRGGRVNYPFNAALESGPQMVSDISNNILCLRGIFIDEVSTRIGKDTLGEHTHHDICQFWNIVRNALVPSGDDAIEGRYQALWRTIIMDTANPGNRLNEPGISRATNWMAQLDQGTVATDILEQEGVGTDLSIGHMTFRISNIGRGLDTLFETRNRRFGITCPHVLPGDKICLLYGGHFPFVLREVGTFKSFVIKGEPPTKKQAYIIIGGETYVHGLMDGEGLKLAAQERLTAEDICLV